MNLNQHLQAILILGFITVVLMLFFVPVPPANAEFFKTALTALISFISGAAIAVAAVKSTRDKSNEPEEPTP